MPGPYDEPMGTAASEPVIGQLGEVWGSTVEACAGLSPGDWERPTECPGWSVRDQLSHLIGIERSLMGDAAPMLEGPVAIAFVHGDAVVAAKALRDFGRTNPALVLKGGLLGPRVLSGAEVHSLADIEPRDVLLARLAGGFQAPLVKAAGLFSAFTRNFAYGIKAYVDQRVAGGESMPESTVEVSEHAPDAERAAADGVSPDAANEAIEVTDESENNNAEQASADGVSPAAASEAEEMES